MALESASYISQLNSANPAPTDLIGQGDDHLRLIKAVLKTTFPNLTGPVTSNQAELNLLDGIAIGGLIPFGIITAWYGASGDVPTGWAVCNGAVVAKSDGSGNITVPDLRDRVLLGVGTLQPTVGGTHGAANQSATTASAGAHTHATSGSGGHIHPGVTVAGHVLAISEMPAHTHGFISGGSGTTTNPQPVDLDTNGSVVQQTHSTGGGAAHSHDISWPVTPDGTHSHDISTEGAHTHGVTVSVYQPAMALHYIMKV